MAGKFVKFNDYLDYLQDYTGITRDQCLFGLSNHNLNNAINLVQIATNLNLDAEKLYKQNIDLEALKRHHQGQKEYIPTRYQENAYSPMRSLFSLAKHYRIQSLDKWMLKRLQINLEAQEMNSSISYNAINECFLSTSKIMSEKDFKAVGANNAKGFLQTVYGENVKRETSFLKKIETLFLHSPLVEQNFDYKIISIGSDSIQVKIQEREQLKAGKYYQNFTNPQNAFLRIGFVEEAVQMLGGIAQSKIIDINPEKGELEITFHLTKLTRSINHGLGLIH